MATGTLKFKRDVIDGTDAICIIGPFDANELAIDSLVKSILAEGKSDVMFDLQNTTHLTSQGIACIIKTLKQVQTAGGDLFIRGATQDMQEYLCMHHLNKYVKLV